MCLFGSKQKKIFKKVKAEDKDEIKKKVLMK